MPPLPEPGSSATGEALETLPEPPAASQATQEALLAEGKAAFRGDTLDPPEADPLDFHEPDALYPRKPDTPNSEAPSEGGALRGVQAQPATEAVVHRKAAEGMDWTTVTEHSLAALGFAASDLAVQGPLAERAGVIASFILNAHFIPGWPPPRPISALETAALMQRLGASELKPALTADEVEKLLYLSKLGLLPEQLARLLKAIAKRPRRSKILDALAMLLTNMGAVLGVLREELAALADELSAREAVAVEARPGRRSRIDLR